MKPLSPDLFIFAGEHSADLHGAALIVELKKTNPKISILAVAGPHMRKAGVECLMPMENFQVMGFVDVFFALPKIITHFYALRKKILKLNPKMCLFIDYPGFNLRMEKSLRKKGFSGKIFHYISPTVWAWKKDRAKTLEENIDHLFVIFPFEKEFFAPYHLSVDYVGHPLVERVCATPPPHLKTKKPLLAVFPGSRKKEILRNFPLYVRAFIELRKEFRGLFLGVSCIENSFRKILLSILQEHSLKEGEDFTFYDNASTYSLMASSTLAFAKSGTVVLELGLLQTPTVVTYAISKLDEFIADKILKIHLPYYSMVNILMKKEVFPELIGHHFTLEALIQAGKNFLLHKKKQEECKKACQELVGLLGDKKPSEELAHYITSCL